MELPVDQTGPSAYDCAEAKPMFSLATFTPAVRFTPAFLPAIRPGEGVKHEMKSTQFKEGIVSVKECLTPKRGIAYWELRYTDPDTGYEVKRRVNGLEQDEVKEMAKNLTRRAYQGKGYLAGQNKTPTVAEGISEALALTNTLKTTRDERIRWAKKFVLWLGEHYPAVKTWNQMRPVHLQAYVVALERDGKAFDTVRLKVAPIKLAWRYMAENYPEQVKPLSRVKLASPPPREIECLDVDELAVLLVWLRVNKPDLWPMACLQGLAGLRMLEAAALRVQDVDLEAHTVTITETPTHKPKTGTSWRTIPVCDDVVTALKIAIAGQKIRPATGEIFTNEDGELWSRTALGHRWTYTLRRAARDLFQIEDGKDELTDEQKRRKARLLSIPARKLRAAFATMAGRLGAPDRLVKAYMGHSSGDILGGHYRRIELNELRSISDLMKGWRMVEKAGAVRKDSGNIPESQIANG